MGWVFLLVKMVEILADPSVVFGGILLFLVLRIFKGNTWLPLSIIFVGLFFEVMFFHSGERVRLTSFYEFYELAPALLIYFSGIAVWFFSLEALAAAWPKMLT